MRPALDPQYRVYPQVESISEKRCPEEVDSPASLREYGRWTDAAFPYAESLHSLPSVRVESLGEPGRLAA
jgi:hypothetical protein